MKRLLRERERFPKESSEFFVNFKDDNVRSFEAYIVGPDDSLYKHKFVKLKFDIPSNYPLVPPKVTFVQHTGDRVHPNLYTEGKVCLSILGNWPGDPWSYSMNIESVLITIRSLLDKQPYLHEPRQSDNPMFNDYVHCNTWRWLLLDYLDREQDPDAKEFLLQYVRQHGAEMVEELERQKRVHGGAQTLTSPYVRGVQRRSDYDALLSSLKNYVRQISQPSIAPSAAKEAGRIVGGKRKAVDDPELV